MVYAQNMIYSHSISVFDQDGNAVADIPDAVDLAAFGPVRMVRKPTAEAATASAAMAAAARAILDLLRC